jgi:hypothetical protein
MAVRQLSVFLENKQGMLVEVTEALTEAGVDIRALSLAESDDYGIMRLIVSDTDRALEAVRATGRTVTVNRVVGLKIADRPGGLHEALAVLGKADINIGYMYAFISEKPGEAEVVLRVSDTAAAEKLLLDSGFELL